MPSAVTKNTLTAFLLKCDDKMDFRLPKDLKRELKTEAVKKGFPTASKYILAIVLERGK